MTRILSLVTLLGLLLAASFAQAAAVLKLVGPTTAKNNRITAKAHEYKNTTGVFLNYHDDSGQFGHRDQNGKYIATENKILVDLRIDGVWRQNVVLHLIAPGVYSRRLKTSKGFDFKNIEVAAHAATGTGNTYDTWGYGHNPILETDSK